MTSIALVKGTDTYVCILIVTYTLNYIANKEGVNPQFMINVSCQY